MKFRKKPVVIEAWRVSELLRAAAKDWSALPKAVASAYEAGEMLFVNEYMLIRTLEGDMKAERADMLIRGLQGEFYPCKPDIFAATYELVEDNED